MPYRRLPNTDQSRLKALQKVYDKIENSQFGDPIIPFELQYQVKMIYPEFKQAVDLYKKAYQRQVENSKQYKELFRLAKLYVSHFIQVMNMAIQRGELPAKIRKLFDLPENSLSLPQLQTEKQVLEWGQKIIQAEEQRIAQGQTPIQNPRISLVKIYYEKFKDAYFFYKQSQKITEENLKNIAQMRPKVDKLIQKIWNEVENHFKKTDPDNFRQKAKDYGIVYVYRKNEKL